MIRTRNFYCALLAFIFLPWPAISSAVTIRIGDVDSFGYQDIDGHKGAYGGAADIDGNGVLESGDVLPDKNKDGVVAYGRGDDFDHRSGIELAGSRGEIFTDVSLSKSYAGRPGLANDAEFTFQFSVPKEGDSDYGKDHYVSLVYGDMDRPVYALVDGAKVDFKGNKDSGKDGQIWRSYTTVPWSDMVDGMVEVQIRFEDLADGYMAFDYVLLDTQPLSLPGEGDCCPCDLTPVLDELEQARAEREALKVQLEELMTYIKSKLEIGTLVTQKDLAPGQGGVYFIGASKAAPPR